MALTVEQKHDFFLRRNREEKRIKYLNYFLEDGKKLPDLLEICHDFPSP